MPTLVDVFAMCPKCHTDISLGLAYGFVDGHHVYECPVCAQHFQAQTYQAFAVDVDTR